MVAVKIADKIAGYDLARSSVPSESVGDELKVFVKSLLAVDRADKADDLRGETILGRSAADWDNIVRNRDDRPVFVGVGHASSAAESIAVHGISPEKAAYCVAYEGAHFPLQIRFADCNVMLRDLGRELRAESVNVNENAVELLLVGSELIEALVTLRLPLLIFFRYKFCQQYRSFP